MQNPIIITSVDDRDIQHVLSRIIEERLKLGQPHEELENQLHEIVDQEMFAAVPVPTRIGPKRAAEPAAEQTEMFAPPS